MNVGRSPLPQPFRVVAAMVIGAVALGAQMTPALAATGSWTIVSSPNPPASRATLAAVSCPTATSCFAAGDAFGHGKERPLVEHWDGTAWSVMPTPGLTVIGALDALSCASALSCTAVGSRFVGGTGIAQTLVAQWDGSAWSRIPSPTPGQGGLLLGVSCAGTSSCIAVGESIDAAGSGRTLVESWAGSRWSVVTSPSPARGDSWLSGVMCLTASRCVAVGAHVLSQQSSRPLIERWDGTSWTIVPSPNVGSPSQSKLSGVACTGTSACVAVGASEGAKGSITLAEVWDGTAWRIAPSANPASGSGSLVGVSCTSATDCVAVGVGATPVGADVTLIEQWRGTSWALAAHPNPRPSKSSALFGVACMPTAACIAVGDNAPTASTEATLVEQRGR